MTVWRDTADQNRPIVSFPGTNIWDYKDIWADFCIATATEHFNGRFQKAKKRIEELRKQCQQEPTLVSHSLGASINEYVGRFFPRIKQINVNKGAGLSSINRDRGIYQTDIRVVGDCVSCLSYCNSSFTGRRITVFPRTIRHYFSCCGQHKFDNIEQLTEQL
jgi:hypothetical protein